MRVAPVGIEYIHQTWPLVEGFIKSAIDKGVSGELLFSMDNIKADLVSGNWQLLVAVDEQNVIKGAATIAYTNYPLHRVAFITTIGGRLFTSKNTFAQLKVILKQNGATLIHGYGRPSIVRLWRQYEFAPLNTLMEAKL